MNTNKETIVMQPTAMEYRRRVCIAMNFISENLRNDISLEQIADSAAFSMFHFHRIFKAVVGETVSEFTRRIRLESAANRLTFNNNESITEIALGYGFSSSQNFAKAFRLHFGITPSAYRKSKNGNNQSNGVNELSLHAVYDVDSVLDNTIKRERSNTMKAEIKEMPEYNVAYVRKIGPYGKEVCEQAFGELMQWAGPRGYLESGTVIGVYWDNPEITAPEKCRTDACVSVPVGTELKGQVGSQTISGGSYAVCHFEIESDNFEKAWEEAFEWVVDKGYECDDKPCYELYHGDVKEHPEGKWVFDVCIPLKK